MSMEPPRNPTGSLSKEKDTKNSSVGQSQMQKRKQQQQLPTAQELISHYESQGLDTKQASVKVIEDLQKALFFRVMTSTSNSNSNSRDPKGRMLARKLDVINTRLVNLDLKLDSKPGYGQTLAIGVASGAALRGIGSLFPHVAGAFAHIWNAVRSATTGTPPPP